MEPVEKAAYIMSQSACALIEAMGMQAENKVIESMGHKPVMNNDDFRGLIEKYGIHHNGVMKLLND